MTEPTGNPNGRPPKYDSPEEIIPLIEGYFDKCISDNKKITLTGLIYHLRMTKDMWYDYIEKPDFSYSLKIARLRVELRYEERLDEPNVAGVIFALKNMGWADASTLNNRISDPNGNPIPLAQPVQIILPANGRES